MNDGVLSKKWTALAILVLLLVLVFFIIRPFFTSILFGIIIAYILGWPYNQLARLIKHKTTTAIIICIIFFVVVGVGVYLLAQTTIREAFTLYMDMGKIDILKLTSSVVDFLFPNSPQISTQISTTIQTSITDLVNTYVQSVKKLILNVPQLIAEFFIAFLVAFYCLKDKEAILNYIREILPFEPDINEKFIKRSKDISFATIYGQIVVGIIQGITAGIGFYLFGAQSPLLMTLLAIFFAMLPLLGAWVIWIPVALALVATGSLMNGIFMAVYGLLIVGTIDNIVRPFIVGKKSRINPVIIFLGMVGGLALMGPVGIIAGPIVLEYTLIFIELYRKGNLKLKK